MATLPSYSFFDHTGDYGLDLQAASPEDAVAGVARAFLELLCGPQSGVAAREAREVDVEGLDPADTLVAFANELLFLFETEGFLCARFDPEEVGEDFIVGRAWGETYDPARHPIERPMKAVTHHQARFESADDGVRVRLIFDL